MFVIDRSWSLRSQAIYVAISLLYYISMSFLKRSPVWSLPNRKNDFKTLEYLAKIVVSHDVDAKIFFNSIVAAWKSGEADCDQIHVSCRSKTDDWAVVLLEEGPEVLGQIHVSTQILKESSDQLVACVKRLRREDVFWQVP